MRKIKLTQGKYALVDNEDFERINAHKWCASQESRNGLKWYAIRRERRKLPGESKPRSVKLRMHREIMGLPTGFEDSRVVDHCDDNGLNNQRKNLQVLDSNAENMHKVPTWKKRVEPWL